MERVCVDAGQIVDEQISGRTCSKLESVKQYWPTEGRCLKQGDRVNREGRVAEGVDARSRIYRC